MKKYLFLEQLLTTHSPSGYEIKTQKLLMNELKEIKDAVITNQNGNVIHIINQDAKTKILLAAHIDEVGLIINKINQDGTCSLERIGGARPYMYAGQHVIVINDNQEIKGVIGYTAKMNNLEISDLILDLGTSTKEETKKLVSVGNPVVVDRSYSYLANNMLAAKALDDKLAVYICSEVFKRLKNNTNHGIYFASTVGEETTGRGAATAVQEVEPTLTICLDVTYATDINYRENLSGDVALGKGITLVEGSLMNKQVHQRFKQVCEKLNKPYQIEVAPARTYTDIDSMYTYFKGTPTYLISIPLRYMHSSVEVCSLNDVEDIIEILTTFIQTLETDFNYQPF